MFCTNVWLTAKDPGSVPMVRERLAELGRLSRQEPGCVRFEVYHSQADPRCFLLVERWESQAAWEAHGSAYAFTQIYQPHVLPLIDRTAHPSTLIE